MIRDGVALKTATTTGRAREGHQRHVHRHRKAGLLCGGQGLLDLATGSGYEGTGLLDYQYTCPDMGTTILPGDAKPWLEMFDSHVVVPPGNALSGTNSAGGITYSWSFVRQ